MKYEALITGVVEGVGGLDNIKLATHCATRLRMQMKDVNAMDLKAVEKVPGVLGIRDIGDGEIQVVVGPDIENIYNEFLELTGYSGATSDGVSAEEAAKRGDAAAKPQTAKERAAAVGRKIMDYLGGTVGPVIPIYMCCGMIMAFLNICTTFLGLPADSGVVQIFNGVANAGFYFMPIALGWTAAEKLGVRPALGALLGMALLYETINNQGGLDIFGIPVYQTAYNGSFLPMILGVAFMAPVFHFFKKIVPSSTQYFLLPLFTMLVTVPVVLLILGPAGYLAGTAFSQVMAWLAENAKFLASAVWGAFCPFGIITGMDKAVYSINMPVFDPSSPLYVGYDNLFCPGGLAGNSAIGGAALAAWFLLRKRKNSNVKQLAMTSGITAILGITEPALYGVCLKFGKPFVGSMLGAAVGAMFGALFDLKQFAWAGPGLMTSPTYIAPNGDMFNFWICIATIAVSALAGFIFTMILCKPKAEQIFVE